MEEYVENEAHDACDASAATAEEQDHGAQHQDLQIARQLGLEAERNQLANLGVLKATNGNVAKRLKLRQETRGTNRAGRTAEAAIKQIATLELPAKKRKMQEWKQMIMQEVGRELQAIRPAHEEVIEASIQSFQLELQRLTGQIQEVKSRSRKLENEMNPLKIKKQTLNQRSTQETLSTKEISTVPASAKPTKEKNPANLCQKSYA